MCNKRNRKIEKVIIIGSGPAGWTAAIYAARAGLNPLLFEGALTAENQDRGTLPMGQLALTSEIENYPGFPRGDLSAYLASALDEERLAMTPPLPSPDERGSISGAALVELMRRQAIDFGTRVVSEDVVSVDFSSRPFQLTSSDGEVVWAETTIIATGASAKWLGLPSEERFKNNGVSVCAVCDGALPRFANRPLAVIGGGNSAAEDAEYLSRFASKVYVIHRRDKLRADETLVRRLLANPKIEILWNRTVEEILGDDVAGVTGIRLNAVPPSNTEPLVLDVAGVFVAIGRRPNSEFLGGALNISNKGYITRKHGFTTETDVPGAFAAGDVCDERYCQAIIAAGSGAMAALDAERFLASAR